MADEARVLVTGGAGFIGSHLVDALLARGAERVVVVDNFFLGKEGNLDAAREAAGDRLVVHREDAADAGAMAAIIEAERPDTVYNFATKALLYSFFNPSGACRVNLDLALTLCELLRNGAYPRLVHLSSSEVYGTAQTIAMDEDHPLLAETTYAAGKASADLAVAAYVRMFDVDARILRPFNNYGPRQNTGSFAALIPATVMHVLAGERPVVEGDGEQTRDFIYVADTVDAILALAGADAARGHIYNLASGVETSIGRIVALVVKELGYGGPLEYVAPRTADVRRHRGDAKRAEALIGPLARTFLEEGIARTVQWYVSKGTP